MCASSICHRMQSVQHANTRACSAVRVDRVATDASGLAGGPGRDSEDCTSIGMIDSCTVREWSHQAAGYPLKDGYGLVVTSC